MEVLLDALKDSLIVFPFLFLIYVIMEMIESARNKEKIERALAGKYSPLVAGGLGIIPECGFSVMCAKLYNSKLIKTGTLIAAFIVTSDEGLVVLLSGGAKATSVILLFLCKFTVAVLGGIVINKLLKNFDKEHICPRDGDCIECGKHQEKFIHKFILHPLFHSLKTFAVILIFNVILGYLISLIGEDNIMAFLSQNEALTPLVSCVIGLIPNCASSIILAQGYLNEIITFSGLLAGLSANAGVGILILFKDSKSLKRAFVVICLLIICSLIAGYGMFFAQKLFMIV